MRRSFLLLLGAMACSPAAKPGPAVAELVVPPIPDAGAPVVHAPPPSEPPLSAENAAAAECKQLMMHVMTLRMKNSGLPPQQVQEGLREMMDAADYSMICAGIDPTTWACMAAATSDADVTACTTINVQPPSATIKHPRKHP